MALDLALRRRDDASDSRHEAHRDDAVLHAPFTPRLPSVDLLPPSVRTAVRVSKVRRALLGILALILAVSALAWFLQSASIDAAEASLASAEADNASLQKQVGSYGAIKQLNDQITAQEKLVRTALAADPQAADVIARVKAAAGPGVTLDQLAVTYNGIPDPAQVAVGQQHLFPCPDPAPFTSKIAVGCISITGSTQSRDEISAFLTRAEADPVLAGAFLQSSVYVAASADTPAKVSFTASIGIAPEGLRTPLSPQDQQRIITDSTPKPTPTPSP